MQAEVMQPEEMTYTVEGFYEVLDVVLKNTFEGEVWIKGVIHNYGESSAGHTYFSLCEELENPGDTPKYSISVALFAGTRSRLDAGIELENGMEVRISGKIGAYAPRSQIQMVMSNIDASYTISKLAENRELLLAHLKQKGLLDLNAKTPLSPLPLRIALVTSKGSAAHLDFEDELKKSGFGWEVYLLHTSVQGAEAPDEICRALAAAADLLPDVVALVRGGGSTMDLAAFDTEAVAIAVAEMPVPVFCGIGHEINISIVDSVAHTSTKTPTACAKALIEKVKKTHADTIQIYAEVLQKADQLLQKQKVYLTQLAARIAHAPREALNLLNGNIQTRQASLKNSASHILARQKEKIKLDAGLLGQQVQQNLKNGKAKIDFLKSQINTLDPKKFLEKGWSITHTAAGNLVRSPKDAPINSELVTTIAEGKIKSRVE